MGNLEQIKKMAEGMGQKTGKMIIKSSGIEGRIAEAQRREEEFRERELEIFCLMEKKVDSISKKLDLVLKRLEQS